MTQDYTGEPAAGTAVPTVLTQLIYGVRDSLTCLAGTTDPSSGGTWAAERVGTYWFDETNEVDGAGDDLGGVLKRWETTGATPTYGWRTLGVRGSFAVSPNSVALTVSADTKTWTDLDITAYTEARTLSVTFQVEVQDSNPGGGVYAGLRKNGVTTDALTVALYPQVGGVTMSGQFTIECDSSGVVEYALFGSAATSANLKLAVMGYETRG